MEATFTPDEAVICRETFEPATAKELSKRLKMSEPKVIKLLDKLVDKGALTRGPTSSLSIKPCWHFIMILSRIRPAYRSQRPIQGA